MIAHDNTEASKPFVHAGLRVIRFHEAEDFSSAARYSHFDTSPYMSNRRFIILYTSKNRKLKITKSFFCPE